MSRAVPAIAPLTARCAFAAKWLRQHVYLAAGSLILLTFLVAALFGEQIAPYGPNKQNLLAALEGPSARHWLGTDPLGRDLFSRVLVGARHTLSVAVISVALSCFFGVVLGLISGFVRGPLATAVDAVVDVALTIPNMILAISIAAVMGAGLTGLIIAISISFTPPTTRIVRGRVMEIRAEDYIAAARTIGSTSLADSAKARIAECGDCNRHRGKSTGRPGGAHRDRAGIPGPGRAAADAGMGHAARLRSRIPACGSVYGDCPRYCDFAIGAGIQSSGRRPARLARPESRKLKEEQCA